MKLLTSSNQLAEAFIGLLKGHKHVSFAVAWASCGFSGYDQLVANRKKILRAVVGTHFFQTHPEFIRRFMNDERVRFMEGTDEVFHPKFYLFENSPDDWSCILGSANFTNGAFHRNTEACLIFDSTEGGAAVVRTGLLNALDDYWGSAKPFDPRHLNYYEQLWKRFRKPQKLMAGDFGERRRKAPKPIMSTDLLKMSWEHFLEKVRREKDHHTLDGRIAVLEGARDLFVRHPSFWEMSRPDRKKIAGIAPHDGVDWGWFGAMGGAGTFKNRVNEPDPNLSRALDSIPLDGAIKREGYSDFVNSYKKAFPGGKGHGLATATRLLAMKRPDYFVCFDSANKARLSKAFNVSLDRHDYEEYWDSIIERVLVSRWWNSARPKQTQDGKVWDGRVAFLDSLFYDSKEG
jgi:hypothetical protein